MAISSLINFGVPLDTSQSASSQGLLMPKLQYRFRVLFQNFGVSNQTTELTKQVISATRPSPEFDEITLDTYNSRIKLAGKPKWGDVTIIIRDDATGKVSQLVGEQIQTQFDFYEQSSAASGIDYKFVTEIEILDGGNGTYTPNVLETFQLLGCYVKKAEYKQAEYKTSEAMDITLSIAYDNAIQVNTAGNADSGIGMDVGRSVGDMSTG
jgi:hypothetical protein